MLAPAKYIGVDCSGLIGLGATLEKECIFFKHSPQLVTLISSLNEGTFILNPFWIIITILVITGIIFTLSKPYQEGLKTVIQIGTCLVIGATLAQAGNSQDDDDRRKKEEEDKREEERKRKRQIKP